MTEWAMAHPYLAHPYLLTLIVLVVASAVTTTSGNIVLAFANAITLARTKPLPADEVPVRTP